MTQNLHDAAILPVRMALARAGHLLDLAAASPVVVSLLTARLAPDMMNAAGQIRTVGGFALRSTFPLTGRPVPHGRFADDLRGLRAHLAFASAEIAQLTPADFADAATRRILHRAGEADLDHSGADYLQLFALPNLWFHLSMAYAIFRAKGLAIGKADFDGLHAYPAPENR
jgi:hypothetical protein